LEFVDGCDANPCVNGNCTSAAFGNFRCTCFEGFSGFACDVANNEGSSSSSSAAIAAGAGAGGSGVILVIVVVILVVFLRRRKPIGLISSYSSQSDVSVPSTMSVTEEGRFISFENTLLETKHNPILDTTAEPSLDFYGPTEKPMESNIEGVHDMDYALAEPPVDSMYYEATAAPADFYALAEPPVGNDYYEAADLAPDTDDSVAVDLLSEPEEFMKPPGLVCRLSY
jgi:hypothetical protein